MKPTGDYKVGRETARCCLKIQALRVSISGDERVNRIASFRNKFSTLGCGNVDDYPHGRVD